MNFSPSALAEAAGKMSLAAQNALEIARFGGLERGEKAREFEIAPPHPVFKLRRSHTERVLAEPDRPPVVLVPPMMLAADIFDVSDESSAVATLIANGVDAWVVDFGAPEDEVGGLARSLTDHLLAVSEAVDVVRSITGRDVHLGGYSQGGMFCYQTAALRRSDGIASVFAFGSPVDTSSLLPRGVTDAMAADAIEFIADHLIPSWGLPGWTLRIGFQLVAPIKNLQHQLEFVRRLYDREALLPKEGQRWFLRCEGWVAWP